MYGHSTSNLLKHLRTHGVGAIDLKEVPELLSKLVGMGVLSLEGTQSQDLRRLLSIAGIERVPSIATIRRGVEDLYEARVSRLRSIFNKTYMLALAIDVYTHAGVTMLGVAAHMSLVEKPVSLCLGMVRLSHPVRASEVQNGLEQVLLLFGLDSQREKIACVLSDGSLREQKAIRNSGFSPFPCVCHALNLVVRDVLPSESAKHAPANPDVYLQDPKVQSGWEKTKQWLQRLRKFVPLCRRSIVLEKLTKRPKLENTTRWTSSFEMMVRLLLLRNELEQLPETLLPCLSGEDWNLMEDVVELLRPIHELEVGLQRSKRTMEHLLSLLDTAQTMVCEYIPRTPHGTFVKEHLLDRYNFRMKIYKHLIPCRFAAFADPKHRLPLDPWMIGTLTKKYQTDTQPPPQKRPPSLFERVHMMEETEADITEWAPSKPEERAKAYVSFAKLKNPWDQVGNFYLNMPCSTAYLEGCFSVVAMCMGDGPNTSFKLMNWKVLIKKSEELVK